MVEASQSLDSMPRRRARSMSDCADRSWPSTQASVGLRPSVELPRVYGALLETGYPNGTATLVALADGTTSLYTSGGFGIIGGGAHPQVAAANQKFLRAVEQSFDTMAADDDSNVPATGESVIRALGFGERRAVRAAEADFGNGRHPLSGLFYAAQDVVAQLRLIDQGRQARQRLTTPHSVDRGSAARA